MRSPSYPQDHKYIVHTRHAGRLRRRRGRLNHDRSLRIIIHSYTVRKRKDSR